MFSAPSPLASFAPHYFQHHSLVTCGRSGRCMNINWASRAECNLCQTKNPKLTEEKREGRAGGHYERQEVATKAVKREDSDEEYDEFGRKKKKRRG